MPERPNIPPEKRPKTPYLPDEDLKKAVNLAIQVERPLLLKGEPGCGKTRLAEAVAYELDLPYEAWYIKSTSKVHDGLYTYDALRRLRDAQLAAAFPKDLARAEKVDKIGNYIESAQLGRAFENEKRTVVLIDEIDKADIDFPNDLLLELEERRFQILETGKWVKAVTPPIVFITSNAEKDLPDAFLRRCLFYYIDFPKPPELIRIVNAHLPAVEEESARKDRDEVVNAAVSRFSDLRGLMETDKKDSGKKVSTSELLDWVKALLKNKIQAEQILSKDQLLYPWILLKDTDDLLKRYAPQFLRRAAA